MVVVGQIIFGFGAFLTLLNVYTSFFRFPIHRLFGGTRANFRWVSGVPLVGSAFLWLSIPLLPSGLQRWAAAAISLFDTGGIHWFIFAMWRQGELRSFIRGGRDGA